LIPSPLSNWSSIVDFVTLEMFSAKCNDLWLWIPLLLSKWHSICWLQYLENLLSKACRWIWIYCEWNTLINASFSKMQPILVHCLHFRSYDQLFVTNMANSIALFSGWQNTIANCQGMTSRTNTMSAGNSRSVYMTEYRKREQLEDNCNNVPIWTKLNDEWRCEYR
jgi:hypothetical protein